jgi:hypothetical protein
MAGPTPPFHRRPATARLMRTSGGKFSCLLRHTVATFCLDSPLEDV